jgi:hypothetical protein
MYEYYPFSPHNDITIANVLILLFSPINADMWANNLHTLKSIIRETEVKQNRTGKPDGGVSRMPYAPEGATGTKSSHVTY